MSIVYYKVGKTQMNLTTNDYCVLIGRKYSTELKQVMSTVYYKVGKTQFVCIIMYVRVILP